MSPAMAVASRIGSGFRRMLHHAARPALENEGAEGLAIEPYRGYGNDRELHLMGRVYRQPGRDASTAPEQGDLWASLKRLVRRGAPGRAVTARFGDASQRVVTDRDGYFHVRLRLHRPPASDAHWQRVTLQLHLPSGSSAMAAGEVYVPPPSARFVVISDIDDTVMWTGVANKARTFWRLFAEGAASRTAFPGVPALYRALHGAQGNPLLYVSRGPWSIYSMLEVFFRAHQIPVGPVLFLREWGISLRHPLPRRAPEHKLALIRQMLDLYADLPFVLIGDSGQHDPETYARVVREHPGRVSAIYIRNVSSNDVARIRAIEWLSREVSRAGSSLMLAADSVAMAEHAAVNGLVPEQTPADVAAEYRSATGQDPDQSTRTLKVSSHH